MNPGDLQSINVLSRVLLMSFLLSILLSLTYLGYIKKGKSWIIPVQFFIVLLILIPLAVSILVAVSSNPLTTLASYLALILLLLLLWGKYSRFKCLKKKKIGEIDGIPIFMCYEKKSVYNAWFNPWRKEIGITKSLFDVLSDDERKAVLYHEVGHSKNKLWNWMTGCMRVLWLVSASLVLTLVFLIVFSDYDVFSKITLSATFLALLPMYAVSVMISSWINEHEADIYAVKVVGFKPVAIALVKLHVYSDLRMYEQFIASVEFSNGLELEGVSYKDVLKAILRRVFVYLDYRKVLSQPLPETHPSLRLRLEKILK